MKVAQKYLVASILCTVVCAHASDDPRAAVDITEAATTQIIARRLKEKDVYTFDNSFEKDEEGRALKTLTRKGNVLFDTTEEVFFDRKQNKFLRAQVIIQYEAKYPHNFIEQKSVTSETKPNEKTFFDTQVSTIRNSAGKWAKSTTAKGKTDVLALDFIPNSLAQASILEAASLDENGAAVRVDNQNLRAPTPSHVPTIFAAVAFTDNGEYLGRPYTSENWMNSSDSFYKDGKPIRYSSPNLINDSSTLTTWRLRNSVHFDLPNFSQDFMLDAPQKKNWARVDYAQVDSENEDDPPATLSNLESFSAAEYEPAIESSLAHAIKMTMKDSDGNVTFGHSGQTHKQTLDGKEFIVSDNFNCDFNGEDGKYLLKHEHVRDYFEASFPYALVRESVHVDYVDAVTKKVVKSEDEERTKKNGRWFKGNQEIHVAPEPTLQSEIVEHTWLKSADRKIDDELSYATYDFDNNEQSVRKLKIVGKMVEAHADHEFVTGYLIDGDLDGIHLRYQVDLPELYPVRSVDGSSVNFEVGTTENSVGNPFDDFDRKLLANPDVRPSLERAAHFQDGKLIFYLTMKEAKVPVESPDQIVHTIDKDRRVYQVTLGHGINSNYVFDDKNAVSRPEDSDIPDDWINQIRAKIAPNAKQEDIAKAILEFVEKKMRVDSKLEEVLSISEIVKDPHGLCREYASITSALMRRFGIKAKMVGGFRSPNSMPNADRPHAVVEAVIDGKSQLIEPQLTTLGNLQKIEAVFYKVNEKAFVPEDAESFSFENPISAPSAEPAPVKPADPAHK